jgi:mycothiol synthase
VPTTVTTPTSLEPDTVAAVRAVIARVAAEDGRDPLSDQALTNLTSSDVRHAVAVEDDTVVGYAQLDDRSLEIAAATEALDPLLDEFAGRPVLIWSHGRGSRLMPVLERRGLHTVRELWQLRRPLTEPQVRPPVPEGVDLRPFVVGRDEDAWLAVNAAAFAHHPEQGRWTRADIEAREAEAWFDPSGFLMAWRGDQLVGFHWTKVHPDGAGEVYVIGVAPTEQGTGLGKVLLQHGLAALRDRGCDTVLLYVDGDNTVAMALYERTGFVRHDLDVQWSAEAPDQSSSSGTVSNT